MRPAVQQVLDAITDAPAWVRNGRHDILAMNQLARALYSPVLEDPRRPANTTRFVYLHPEAARELFVDYDQIARDAAAMLRLEAGRNPHDKALIELVGELSTQSELFRQRWASQDVRYHRSGRKRLRHPVVGQLDLDFEALELPSEPGLAAQHLHRTSRHPHLRRPQAPRLLGSQPGNARHRADTRRTSVSDQESADSPAATAKPRTAARPALSLAFSVASGIIEPTSMTSRAPAAKPSTAASNRSSVTCEIA